MGIDTLLVAVGEREGRIESIADAVIDVADPTETTVVIAHVLDKDAYQRAIDETGEESSDEFEEWFTAQIPDRPGIEGDVPEWVKRWSRGARAEEVDPETIESLIDRKELIGDLARALEDAGIEYQIRGDVGDPADRIVAMADELDADFVVVGGRRRSAARKAVFGSVSQDIIRSVSCPVISVQMDIEE